MYIEKSTGITWINKALIYEMYKKELENDAKKPTDFKRDIDTFCNKILQMPIQEFMKKKENGVGKTVEHFCFKVLAATQVSATPAIDDQEQKDDLLF